MTEEPLIAIFHVKTHFTARSAKPISTSLYTLSRKIQYTYAHALLLRSTAARREEKRMAKTRDRKSCKAVNVKSPPSHLTSEVRAERSPIPGAPECAHRYRSVDGMTSSHNSSCSSSFNAESSASSFS